MIALKPNSLQEKIFQALAQGQLPLEQLYAVLGARKDTVDKTLRQMAAAGLVLFDRLPDITYVSLATAGVQHQNIRPMASAFRQKSSRPKEDNRAYG